jgi:HAD superfamily hydrolase (TIGR01509 family)
MRTNHLFIIIFALIITSVAINARRMPKKNNNITTPTNVVEKPVIVFDLINVLFKESYIGFAQKIGYGTLANYALTHWKNPGHRCLDMLHSISNHETQKPHVCLTINGRTMPRCLVELQTGKQTCAQTKEEIAQAIAHLDTAKFFSSIKEKNLMSSIMNLMLDPAVISHVTEPIKQMVTLAQKLKNNGYDLYLCANVPQEFYTALQKKYPDIIQLFKGVIISSEVKKVKPEKEMFEHLLNTHKLSAQNCIVIDTMPQSIDVAKQLGMRTILYNKASQLTNELKKYGVVV